MPQAPVMFFGQACCTPALGALGVERRWLRQISHQYDAEVCDRFGGVSSVGARSRKGAHQLGSASHAWPAHPRCFSAPPLVDAFVTRNCVSVARRRGCLPQEIA